MYLVACRRAACRAAASTRVIAGAATARDVTAPHTAYLRSAADAAPRRPRAVRGPRSASRACLPKDLLFSAARGLLEKESYLYAGDMSSPDLQATPGSQLCSSKIDHHKYIF
ncbi:jg5036 [Pararge aegeria aegeria]|uniref:Jg5036 protein n=1 Tax=Pararge aegeria aegeria TaxID=348720 RepID=A0A8S4SJ20_9NEOP|nr:jg5036 [Pararge aegeria aegeria]